MYIPGHLIIEEEKQRRDKEHSGRIPLYAPRPQDRMTRPEGSSQPEEPRRRSIVIDLNDYSEIDE